MTVFQGSSGQKLVSLAKAEPMSIAGGDDLLASRSHL